MPECADSAVIPLRDPRHNPWRSHRYEIDLSHCPYSDDAVLKGADRSLNCQRGRFGNTSEELMRLPVTRRWLAVASAAAIAAAMAPLAGAQSGTAAPPQALMHINCASSRTVCTEVHDSEQVFGEDVYVGHDEPATLFYDNRPGAGNDNTYFLRLPKDPPRLPKQDGSGGTFNFHLPVAFWFGTAMCATEPAPRFTQT